MMICIENEHLKVEIKRFGAELKSIINKENGQEYMWEADPAFWGKTSPILFPFIGKLEGGGFRYKDTFYEMDKHGFARDMDYDVVLQEERRVIFAIESTEETLKKFPFPFRLEVEYSLEGNCVSESWRVINKGEETMHFSLGGHPAFACPLVIDGEKNRKRTDCKVNLYGENYKLVKEETLFSTQINVADGLLTGEIVPINIENGSFPIVDHIFDNDALVFARQNITAVGLADKEGHEYICLEAVNCPVWGIWSMPTSDASYVCIEPWWGICDSKGYEGSLEERPYTNVVGAGKVWEEGFRIIVGE